jgi:ATP phosphoribosyltransferase regulatory subunit HisZ
VFELEENAPPPASPQTDAVPALANMSAEWREEFRQALARKNITRIRKLGEEARATDPVLAAWLLERAGQYDVDGLKQLGA